MMFPTGIALVLAGLGAPAPSAPAKVRDAAVMPAGQFELGVGLNASGEFDFCGESPERAKANHRPLAFSQDLPDPRLTGLNVLAVLGEWAGPAGCRPAVTVAAIEVARRRLVAEPANAGLMVELGRRLGSVGRFDEAEAWLRRATQTAPRDHRTWHELASHHLQMIGRSICPTGSAGGVAVGDFRLPVMRGALARALAVGDRDVVRRFQAVGDCFDWAVLLCPDAVEPYVVRVGWTLACEQVAPASGPPGATARQVSADARRIAELSGHPLAYGVALCADLTSEAGPEPGDAAYWNRAAGRLARLCDHPDPRTRADARRVLIMVRCAALGDFEGGEKLLWELPDRATDPTVRALAHLVYGGAKDCRGMIRLADERLKVADDPYDHFLRVSCWEKSGNLPAALDAARTGVKAHPTDVKLNLARTALLLRSGAAADLAEAHLRLRGLETEFDRRLAAGPFSTEVFNDQDRGHLQLVRLHRAVYLALTGRPRAATQMADTAAAVGPDHAAAAAELLRTLNPTPVLFGSEPK